MQGGIYLNPVTGETCDTNTDEGKALHDRWSQNSQQPVRLHSAAAMAIAGTTSGISDRPVDVDGPGAVWNQQTEPDGEHPGPGDPEGAEKEIEAAAGSDDGEDAKLTGAALNERAAELDIEGRSEMTAQEKRDAIEEAEKA